MWFEIVIVYGNDEYIFYFYFGKKKKLKRQRQQHQTHYKNEHLKKHDICCHDQPTTGLEFTVKVKH